MGFNKNDRFQENVYRSELFLSSRDTEKKNRHCIPIVKTASKYVSGEPEKSILKFLAKG